MGGGGGVRKLKRYTKRRNTLRSVTFWLGSEVGDQRAISLESES